MATIHPGLCKKCGRPKSKQGFDERGRQRFACRRAACRFRSTPRPDEDEIAVRPWCVRCRRPMGPKCRGRLRCTRCGVTCATDHAPRRHYILDRPDCPACGRPMTLGKHKKFRCQRRYCKGRKDAITWLAASVAARLPGYLTPDERGDATQSIVLDVLAGRVSPEGLTPKVLRGYAARARGLVRDRFKFTSLSEATHDGREFGDTLAA